MVTTVYFNVLHTVDSEWTSSDIFYYLKLLFIVKHNLDIVFNILTKGARMLKHIIISMFIGISFIYADNTQSLEQLKAEKEALILKLEVYELKQKIIERQNFIENDKLAKEKKRNRNNALLRLKNDLKSNRHKVTLSHLTSSR